MPRFKLIAEYAGTRYSGWQIQKNARTVQGGLDHRIRTVTKRSDFESFAGEDAHDDGERSTVVVVERFDVVSHGSLVLVSIEGSLFLWRMVRRIVGVLVEMGRGRLDPTAAAAFMAESSEAPARLT